MDDQDDLFGRLAGCLPPIASPSQVKRRLIKSAVAIDADDPDVIVYQHTVLCQTCLPYRDPGAAAVRRWQRSQGFARLEVEAGRALDPERDEFVDIGLPFGPKPRLILAHLNAEAIRRQSPLIDVGHSLTEFVKRIRGFKGGRELRAFQGSARPALHLAHPPRLCARRAALSGRQQGDCRPRPGFRGTSGSGCCGPRSSAYRRVARQLPDLLSDPNPLHAGIAFIGHVLET